MVSQATFTSTISNWSTAIALRTHSDPVSPGLVDVFDVLTAVNVAFQNGSAVVDAGCSFANTDVSPTDGCNSAVDVFDVIVLGVFPGPFIEWVKNAADMLLAAL